MLGTALATPSGLTKLLLDRARDRVALRGWTPIYVEGRGGLQCFDFTNTELLHFGFSFLLSCEVHPHLGKRSLFENLAFDSKYFLEKVQ
jgi:hypothetical protein